MLLVALSSPLLLSLLSSYGMTKPCHMDTVIAMCSSAQLWVSKQWIFTIENGPIDNAADDADVSAHICQILVLSGIFVCGQSYCCMTSGSKGLTSNLQHPGPRQQASLPEGKQGATGMVVSCLLPCDCCSGCDCRSRGCVNVLQIMLTMLRPVILGWKLRHQQQLH